MSARRIAALALVCVTGTLVTQAPADAAGPGYPSGTFTVQKLAPDPSQTDSWGYPLTKVRITVDTLSDDVTPAHLLHVRLDVDSGNSYLRRIEQAGTPAGQTQGVAGWTLTLESAGTVKPVVTITDADGHQTVQSLPTVTVTEDTTAPALTVTAPKPALRNTVRGWKLLQGTAADPESTVRRISAQVLQRRAGIWWVYDGDRGVWLRGTRSEAFTRRWLRQDAVPSVYGDDWVLPLRGLTKGLLVIDLSATTGRTAKAPQVRVGITRR